MNIFIDTEDIEERYGEELYKEYLERENKELKQKVEYYENFEINKTIDKIRVENNKRFKEQQEEIESLKQINEEHQKLNGELRVKNKRLNNIINELNSAYCKVITKCEEMIDSRFYMNDIAIKKYADEIKDICKYYVGEAKELKGSEK